MVTPKMFIVVIHRIILFLWLILLTVQETISSVGQVMILFFICGVQFFMVETEMMLLFI
jgi:hypothetical protein